MDSETYRNRKEEIFRPNALTEYGWAVGLAVERYQREIPSGSLADAKQLAEFTPEGYDLSTKQVMNALKAFEELLDEDFNTGRGGRRDLYDLPKLEDNLREVLPHLERDYMNW